MGPELILNVGEIEQLQMIKDTAELEKLFTRAKSTIVQGGAVLLSRTSASGQSVHFDQISNEKDLDAYKKTIFKYL